MEVFYGRDILLLAPLLLLCGMQLIWMRIPAGRIGVPDRALDIVVCCCVTLAVGTLLRYRSIGPGFGSCGLLLRHACGWDTAAAVSMDDTADSDGFFGLSVYRKADAHGEDSLY